MKIFLKTALLLVLGLSIASSAFAATYDYDRLNRLTKVTYASGKTITYTYDPAGNVLSVRVTYPQQP